MDENDDDDVVGFFRDGDKEAFNRLFKRFFDPLVHHIEVKFGDFHLAEDAAIETWHAIHAMGGSQLVADTAHFWNLLKLIGNQRAIDNWRRRRPAQELPSEDQQGTPFVIPAAMADPIVKLIQQDELARLAGAIRGLRLPHRAVVIMYYLEDIPVETIATNFNVSEGTVYRWLHEARQELLRYLSDGEQGLR